MTLTANGFFKQSDETHPIPKEILADFGAFIMKTGNLINGRKTFEILRQSFSKNSFPGVELVVVSQKLQKAEGFCVAKSPQVALDHLKQKNFTTTLVAGGAELNTAFLSEGLIDEIYLNIAPTLTGKGINLSVPTDRETGLELIDMKSLSDHILQLHYRVIHNN